MKRMNKVVLGVVVGCVLASLPALAQPGGGGGRGGGGGGIAPEQVLALLAFDDQFAVTDKQLIALRSSLKETYVKQQEMMEEMSSGDIDWQAMREKMRESQTALRSEVMAKVSAVLSAEQVEKLKTHMQELQERRGQFGGGGGGPRGGGGGGGGGF